MADTDNGLVERDQGNATAKRGRPRKNIAINYPEDTTDTSTETSGGETEGGRGSKEQSFEKLLGIPIGIEPKKQRKRTDFDKTLESNVRLLLKSSFDFISQMTQSPLWKVSDEEVQTISQPLARILARMGATESMNKYADYIALATGLIIIVVPRMIIYQQMTKKEGKANDKKAENKESSRGNVKPITDHNETSIKHVLDLNF